MFNQRSSISNDAPQLENQEKLEILAVYYNLTKLLWLSFSCNVLVKYDARSLV